MAAIAMALFVNTVDLGSIGVALPTLVRELETDFATIQWIPLVTLLVQTTRKTFLLYKIRLHPQRSARR